jgi:hypothetical protein
MLVRSTEDRGNNMSELLIAVLAEALGGVLLALLVAAVKRARTRLRHHGAAA